MSRLCHKLSRRTLDLMYKTFVRPTIEYACVVWDGCSEATAGLLENVQLRAGRIVCGAIRHTSHEVIYSELGWEKLAKRRERFKLLLYHKMVYTFAPTYLCNMLPTSVAERTPYPVRSANILARTPFRTRLALFDKSFIPATTRLWNQLPTEVQSITNVM